jgi:hypothetical protein
MRPPAPSPKFAWTAPKDELVEGDADFLGEMISGGVINQTPHSSETAILSYGGPRHTDNVGGLAVNLDLSRHRRLRSCKC